MKKKAKKDLPTVQLGLKLDFPAKITSTSLEFVGRLSYEDGRQTLFKIAQVDNASNWWLAACIVEGEKRWGEEWAQAVGEAGISPPRALKLRYVYDRFPETLRVKELSWSHHVEIAPLETLELRGEWLVRCLKGNWTIAELKQQLEDSGLRAKGSVGDDPGYDDTNREKDADGNNGGGGSGPAVCPVCGSEEATIKVGSSCFAQLVPDAEVSESNQP